jgi:hypothetical protein
LSNAHTEEFLCSPVLIKNIIGILAQFFHISPDKHLAKFNKVTVLLIVNFNNTPGIGTSTDGASIRSLNKVIRANNSKRNLAGDFLGLGDSLLILIFISGCLENLDVVVSNIGQNLRKV